MPTYLPQPPTSKGVTLVFNTSANGDKVPAGCTLIVRNTIGSTQTVTLITPGVVDGDLAIADRVSDPIPATTGVVAIKVPLTETYRDPADGLVTLNFSTPGATLNYAVIS